VLPADPSDAEDGNVSQEGMRRGQSARLIRMTRSKLGLSQQEFAARFCVALGTLRDWEQARVSVPDHAMAYIRVIAAQPDMVARLVA